MVFKKGIVSYCLSKQIESIKFSSSVLGSRNQKEEMQKFCQLIQTGLSCTSQKELKRKDITGIEFNSIPHEKLTDLFSPKQSWRFEQLKPFIHSTQNDLLESSKCLVLFWVLGIGK